MNLTEAHSNPTVKAFSKASTKWQLYGAAVTALTVVSLVVYHSFDAPSIAAKLTTQKAFADLQKYELLLTQPGSYGFITTKTLETGANQTEWLSDYSFETYDECVQMLPRYVRINVGDNMNAGQNPILSDSSFGYRLANGLKIHQAAGCARFINDGTYDKTAAYLPPPKPTFRS